MKVSSSSSAKLLTIATVLALAASVSGQQGSLLGVGVLANDNNIANVGTGGQPGNIAQVGGCPAGLIAICTGSVCSCVLPGSGSADPILSDFAGNKFEFFGEAGEAYNIYSDEVHQVNMKLFPGFVDGHNGTYMSEFGIAFHNYRVNVSLVNDGDILVETWVEAASEAAAASGKNTVRAGAGETNRVVGRKSGNVLTVKTEPFKPWTGRTVEIATGILEFSVWSVPAGTIDRFNVTQPAYLNFNISLTQPPAGDIAEGIIGESLQQALDNHIKNITGVSAESVDPTAATGTPAVFSGKGLMNDYRVTGLFGTDFAFNQYNTKTRSSIVARRAMLSSPFSILNFPLRGTSA